MNTNDVKQAITAIALGFLTGMTTELHADTFGSGENQFAIDFVTVGNPGNADDAGAGGGQSWAWSSFGSVPYTYRLGVYEIPTALIEKATTGGMMNVVALTTSISMSPARQMSWYEAAAFVNWLNTSTGHNPAYNLSFNGEWSMSLWGSGDAWQLGGENLYRRKDAYYFLPSEDEWYKAAYHKNDGITANYWDYATGGNMPPIGTGGGTAPGTAIYGGGRSGPQVVNLAGGLSPYGTMGQNGNVREWTESAYDGINNETTEYRSIRGGDFGTPTGDLISSGRTLDYPSGYSDRVGFRVASVPEPTTFAMLAMLGVGWLLRKGSRKFGSGRISGEGVREVPRIDAFSMKGRFFFPMAFTAKEVPGKTTSGLLPDTFSSCRRSSRSRLFPRWLGR